MRKRHVLLAFAAAGAASGAAVVASERRLLRRMNEAPLPSRWSSPRFPEGSELMVPTDDGAELVVARAGAEHGPAVVLVHGLTSNHHDWGPVAAALVDRGFHVVGINQRGHGGSTVGSEGFGPARQGADVGQVLAALDLDDVTLCGHSMGGIAALSLLTLRPETGAGRVGRLVPIATLADAHGRDRRAALKVGNTQQYRNLADHPQHAAAMARFLFGAPTPNRAMVDQSLQSYLACPFETRVGAAQAMVDYDVRHLLADIELPTVVICGTHDRLTSHRENKAIADAIPGATFVSVADAGHMVIWENAGLIARTIAELASSATESARA